MSTAKKANSRRKVAYRLDEEMFVTIKLTPEARFHLDNLIKYCGGDYSEWCTGFVLESLIGYKGEEQ